MPPTNITKKANYSKSQLTPTTPEGDVSVNGDKEDIYVAIRDAFTTTGRQLNEMQAKSKNYLRSA